VSNSRNRVHCDFVSLSVDILNGRVIRVFVRDEELPKEDLIKISARLALFKAGATHRCLDVTAIGVLALSVENLLVELNVVVVDCVIEGDCDHHGDVLGREVTGNRRAVFAAEAVGEDADGWVTRWCAVWIVVDVCRGRKRGILKECLSRPIYEAICNNSQYPWLNIFPLCPVKVPPPLSAHLSTHRSITCMIYGTIFITK
jgi:hypothetical protein